MGSIVHQGVNLAQQIHYFTDNNIECRNWIIVLVWLIRCLSSFYQLYFAYKYSNVSDLTKLNLFPENPDKW